MKPLRLVLTKYPITRGMLVYAILWPSSDLCRQLAAAGLQHDKYSALVLIILFAIYHFYDYRFSADIQRLARFSLFGSLWVAPTVYAWVRLSSRLVAGTTLRSAVTKAVMEQFTYGPFSIVAFYFGMSKLEGKSTEQSLEEVKRKFVSTWKVIATT